MSSLISTKGSGLAAVASQDAENERRAAESICTACGTWNSAVEINMFVSVVS